MGNKATVYLYKAGNECSAITGGWTGKNFFDYGETVYYTKASTYLDYGDNGSNGYGYGGFITNNKINFSYFSNIYIDWEKYKCVLNIYSGTNKSGGGHKTLFLASSTSCGFFLSGNKNITKTLIQVNSARGDYKLQRETSQTSLSSINSSEHVGMLGGAGYIYNDIIQVKTYNLYMTSSSDILSIASQNATSMTVNLNNLGGLISFPTVEIYTNNRLIKTYTNVSTQLVHTFDRSVMDYGNNTIYVKATYSQGNSITGTVDITSGTKYTKTLLVNEFLRIVNQNDTQIEISSNGITNYLSINRIDILANSKIIASYTENLDSITYVFDNDIMDLGRNEISVMATCTQNGVNATYQLVSDIVYNKVLEIEYFEPISDLPETATLKDVIQRFSAIESVNNALISSLRTLLRSKGLDIGDDERLIDMIKKINYLEDYKHPDLYLYDAGNEHTENSGGWSTFNFYKGQNTGNLYEKASTYLRVGDTGHAGYGYGGFYTDNLVDLTNHKYLIIDYELKSYYLSTTSSSASAYVDLIISKSKIGWNESADEGSRVSLCTIHKTVVRKTEIIDISNYTGSYYIGFYAGSGYAVADSIEGRLHKLLLSNNPTT